MRIVFYNYMYSVLSIIILKLANSYKLIYLSLLFKCFIVNKNIKMKKKIS